MRHLADGAVNLNIENDDLANDNYGLYDDKTINLEKPKINENISKENTEYYIVIRIWLKIEKHLLKK